MKNLEERTLIVIKPDGVESGKMFEILSRIERAGLRCVQMFLTQIEESFAREHYERVLSEVPEHIGNGIVKYICSGPVLPAAFQGKNAVVKARALGGAHFNPTECLPGTIRGDFSSDSARIADLEGRSVYNIIHTSDSVESAEREIRLWFETLAQTNYARIFSRAYE